MLLYKQKLAIIFAIISKLRNIYIFILFKNIFKAQNIKFFL